MFIDQLALSLLLELVINKRFLIYFLILISCQYNFNLLILGVGAGYFLFFFYNRFGVLYSDGVNFLECEFNGGSGISKFVSSSFIEGVCVVPLLLL